MATLWVAFVLAFLALRFLWVPYRVEGSSMQPTLHGDDAGADWVLVSRLAYWWRSPERWEIVVLEHPGETRESVKRIVGLPGETVEIRRGRVLINGGELEPTEPLDEVYVVSKGPYGHAPIVLRENEYFLLGDNSYRSRDSRHWGPIAGQRIRGRVAFVVHPWQRTGSVK